MIDCESEKPNDYPQTVRVRSHVFRADVSPPNSTDSAPNPHDYFDASLAACKALTALMYAKHHGYPLERVETHVESDTSRERQGTYTLKVSLTLHGPLNDEQRKKIHAAVAHCPIHKLMTTTDVVIETAPL